MEVWKSFIVANFIKRTLEVAIEECKGCQDSKLSPLLHAHQTTGLLTKLEIFFEQIRIELCDTIENVYIHYQNKFEASTSIPTIAQCFEHINEGLTFLKNINPNSLYYGRYIAIDDDIKIHNVTASSKRERTEEGMTLRVFD